MIKHLIKKAYELREETVGIRRDIHKYPEQGFCEFRTCSVIIKRLQELGFDVKFGNSAIRTESVLGLPDRKTLECEKERAISEGADRSIVNLLDNGGTAVVASIKGTQGGSGKTVAFRFDIDCNELTESIDCKHLPAKNGFGSVHDGCMHACGHDGHIAIGLTLAHLLSDNKELFSGTVKLIFQPAEEGVRGAQAMVDAETVDDVDHFLSGHIGISAVQPSTLYTSTGEFLCASKFDADFFGTASHAGLKPEEGRNALLAAAQSALSLHSISRHGSGPSRINVGVIAGGSGRNVIADHAQIQFETRGGNAKINEYMVKSAERIVASAASMYDVDHLLKCVGKADDFEPDPDFAHEIAITAENSGIYKSIFEYASMNASEDCTAFMNRVAARGGRASYMLFGTELAAPHHTPMFDFDENTMTEASAFLSILAIKYAR